MKRIVIDSYGDCHLCLHYRCRTCGKIANVPDHLNDRFLEEKPSCPVCGASEWDPLEEVAE